MPIRHEILPVTIASDEAPVLWVFQGFDFRWRLRKEGGGYEAEYPSRHEAVLAARSLGGERGSYRLYLQLADGRFALEILNGLDASAIEDQPLLTCPHHLGGCCR